MKSEMKQFISQSTIYENKILDVNFIINIQIFIIIIKIYTINKHSYVNSLNNK